MRSVSDPLSASPWKCWPGCPLGGSVPSSLRAHTSRRSPPSTMLLTVTLPAPGLRLHRPSVAPGCELSVLKGVYIFLLYIQMFLGRDRKHRRCRACLPLICAFRPSPQPPPLDRLTSVSRDSWHHIGIMFLNGFPADAEYLTKSLAHRGFGGLFGGCLGPCRVCPRGRELGLCGPSVGSGCSVGRHRLGKRGAHLKAAPPACLHFPGPAAGYPELRLGVRPLVCLAL